MRGLGLYLAILVGVACAFLGIAYWPNEEKVAPVTSLEVEQHELRLAENYVKKGKIPEAMELISRYQSSIEKQTAQGQQWLALLIQISEQTLDVPQLTLIQEHFPDALNAHEKASLLVSESFVITGRNDEYDLLRKNWIGRETNSAPWLLLDADNLLGKNQYAQAIDFLNKNPMQGKFESSRLTRLALLNTVENPEKALDYLKQAQTHDPLNRDVYLYQARLFENMGKGAEALTAYKQALKNHPKDPGLYDQLAEFYMRHKQYAQALETWQYSLELQGSDEAWLKTLFWGRMILPTKTDWAKVQPPEGKLRSLILYLLDLPKGKFWDEAAFAKIPEGEYYLKTQQETFWLRLLAALQDYDENRAEQLIHQNYFQNELWNPNLDLALLQTLNFRKHDDFIQDVSLQPQNTTIHPSLYNFYRFNNETQTDELGALLKGREAFMANFLAAGWLEAALQLHTLPVMPDNSPEWVVADLALALRKNRGEKESHDFLKKQKTSSKISLMEQELAARIALDAGDQVTATAIYEAVSDKSPEAKSYLARKAFKEKDWEKAQKFTEELLKIYPENILLQDNLKKIQQLKG